MTDRPLRVLVLDDDPEDIELIEDLLADSTLEVEILAAHRMPDALELLEKEELDVCLVDYRLGADSGVDFLRDPRRIRSRVPAILMTGVGTPAVDQAALEAGATDYIPKDELDSQHLARALRYATERRRRQRVESRMNALMGNARELVFIVDAEGWIQYVSPSLERVLGFHPDKKAGEQVVADVHPDDREHLRESLASAVEEPDRVQTLRYRSRHADDGWRSLDATIESHLTEPDIDGLIISAWDVTDRVTAQWSVRFQAELLDAVGQAVIATDPGGEVIYWNPAAERIYGWSRDEAVGRAVESLTTADATREEAGEIMAKLRRGETWEGEFQVTRKDGSTFTALIANSPIFDDEGHLSGIIGASSDITAIKQTERALVERVKELRTLNHASLLLNRSDLDMEERLQRIVESLPEGWLRPERTEARLTLPARTFQTADFRETRWMQSVDLSTADLDGTLEIALTEAPAEGETPFLHEEGLLLESLGSLVEQSLERSSLNTLLDQALASLQEAVFVVGPDRTIRYANAAAQEIFGYSLTELIGATTEKLHADVESFRRFGEESEAILVAEGVYFGTFDMRRKDGQTFQSEQTVSLLDPDRPVAGGVVSVVRDVSAQRAAERELRGSEERFREITEVIDDIFWVTSADEKGIDYLSPAFEEIWGRPAGDIYDEAALWMDAVVPADREKVRRFVERQTEAPQTEEYRIRRPDGEERRILDRSFPVVGPDGTVERIIGVARDVTEERRAEERYGLLIREISDVVYVVAPDGTVLTSSPSILEASGFAQEEFEGTDALALVHPDDRESLREELQRVADQPDHIARAEYRIIDKGGESVWVESVARNLLDNPAIGGILVTSRDVTERHELERRVRQMQKMESVGRLAGGVAHDFNNILTVIRSQADLILMDEPTEDVAADVTVIQDAADRAARLTRQLLAFSREQVMQPQNVDLGDAVRGTSELIARLISEQIKVEYDVAARLPAVRVDPNQVEQVLINLAVNARDAMSGGGKLSIAVGERRVSPEEAEPIPDLDPGHYVVVQVRDTGTGMEPDVLQRIFEPFFTTKEKGEGTGLGLAMVYGTVRQSGGSIQVESVPSEGTTFHLFFPAIDGTVDDEPRGTPTPGRRVDATSAAVLVVEDDPRVRSAARRVLESSGFSVVALGSAEAAVRHLEHEERPDVVLTDLVLEGLSGYALMEQISERWPGLPVVVMSGYAHDSPGRDGLPEGVPFVHKPFTPSTLVGTLRTVLAGRPATD